MNKGAGFIHNISGDAGDPVDLRPTIMKVLYENGDVIVGIGTCITAGARSEQDHALKPLAIDPIQGSAETGEDGISTHHTKR